MGMHTLDLTVNGETVSTSVPARRLLADFLREDLHLTGTKRGCETGICGACTVLVDGQPLKSCLSLAVMASGCEVRTVEGLREGETLHRLQESFVRCACLQCGYCTPGILMSLAHYLESNPSPSEQQLREVIGGHLCRCTGYTHIMAAAVEAAAAMRQAG